MGTLASRVTLFASAVCIVAAVLALYARSAILDRGQFADRAVSALAQDEVGEEIAARFSAGLIQRSPGLVTLRPALEAAAADVAASPSFAARFGAGVQGLHRGIFSADDPRPSLRVAGMTAQVQAAVARRTPVLAQRLPRGDPSLMSIGGSGRERLLLEAAARAGGSSRVAPVALVLGLLGLLLVTLTARDRRRGLWRSGVALAGSGGALLAAWIGARTLTLQGFDTSWGDGVVTTIWDAYLGDLRTWGLGVAGAGIIIAAGAARPEPHERPSWSQIPAPLRGAALLVTGSVVLADRELALDLAAVGAAGVLLYLGARHLLAGRARVALAGAAMLSLAAAVAVASSRPDRVAEAAAAPVARNPAAATGARHSRSRDRSPVASSTGASSGSPRICFASMQDARAAAEGASIPAGAVVKTMSDGRVCVRPG
jgi:hypothetical protein